MTNIPSEISRETMERWKIHQSLIEKWSRALNLVADVNHVWERHVVDCAQLVSHVPCEKIRLLDMGSGAGFPGLTLAAATPCETHLVESDARKAEFLREAARQMDVDVTVHVSRVERLTLMNADVITARALASLSHLCEMAHPHLAPDAFCLFPKGNSYIMELDEARKNWMFDVEIFPSQTSPESALLLLRNLTPR